MNSAYFIVSSKQLFLLSFPAIYCRRRRFLCTMPSRILHLYPQFSIMYQIFPKKEKKNTLSQRSQFLFSPNIILVISYTTENRTTKILTSKPFVRVDSRRKKRTSMTSLLRNFTIAL